MFVKSVIVCIYIYANVNDYKIKHETFSSKEGKWAKIRNRYNQVPHLTQDTTWESNQNTI